MSVCFEHRSLAWLVPPGSLPAPRQTAMANASPTSQTSKYLSKFWVAIFAVDARLDTFTDETVGLEVSTPPLTPYLTRNLLRCCLCPSLREALSTKVVSPNSCPSATRHFSIVCTSNRPVMVW
jgi:hypothetical protein